MATSSIFKEIKPKNKRSIVRLVSALERSRVSAASDVRMSRPVSDMSKDEIRKVFGKDNDRVPNR